MWRQVRLIPYAGVLPCHWCGDQAHAQVQRTNERGETVESPVCPLHQSRWEAEAVALERRAVPSRW